MAKSENHGFETEEEQTINQYDEPLGSIEEEREYVLEEVGDDDINKTEDRMLGDGVILAKWYDTESGTRVEVVKSIDENEYVLFESGVGASGSLDDCIQEIKDEYDTNSFEDLSFDSLRDERSHLVDKVGDDKLDNIQKDGDLVTIACWDSESVNEEVTVKRNFKLDEVELVPYDGYVENDLKKLVRTIRRQYPSTRGESLEHRYENDEFVRTNFRGHSIKFRSILIDHDAKPDIKLRSTHFPNSVIEVHKFKHFAIRLDKEHGYVQYTDVYARDKIPFEAVIDKLRLRDYEVERNKTPYRIDGCTNTVEQGD